MLVFFGAAFACFGIAVSVSRLFPGWFGWVAVVGAGGSVVAALLQIAASGEVQAAETMFLASSVLSHPVGLRPGCPHVARADAGPCYRPGTRADAR